MFLSVTLISCIIFVIIGQLLADIPAIDSDYLFLEIKPSSIPFKNVGQGVFAKVDIPGNEILCEYRGAIISADIPFNSKYSFGSVISTGEEVNIIPDMNLPICAYINDCVSVYNGKNGTYSNEELDLIEAKGGIFPNYEGFYHNSATVTTKMGKIFIVSKTVIKAGDEIFLSYGMRYWMARLRHPDVFGLNL
eukprot:gene7410-10101_t